MATTINQSFTEFKANLNITGLQAQTVSTRQQNVRKVVEGGFTVKESFLTGSYSRNTMIAPLSDADIDIFFVLDNQYYYHYQGQNGGQAGLLDYLKRTLKKTYTKTPDISRNGQAVTIRFDDFMIDVVPAFYRQGGGYLIPNSITQSWLSTDPKKHVELITSSNTAHDGDFIPLVKMIKSWNKNIQSHFHSFHLETLALSIFTNITISDYPSGARYFFDKGRTLISKQNPDPAGYGGDVGYYINNQDKIDEAVSRFQTAYDRAVKAEYYATLGQTNNAIGEWRKIFGNYFPAYG